MREGAIEPTVVPRNALDVLAQQIVAIAAAAEDRTHVGSRPVSESEGSPLSEAKHDQTSPTELDGSLYVESLHSLVRRTYSYSDLSRPLLENVLDMLDGRYPSSEFGELRPRIVWDRVADRIRARKGARQLAIANAGTIPDRGLYAVTLPDGRRVGELDEEMVYEARPGQVFLLGASSWRIEEIGRDRVIVTPAPGVPGAVPFWKGDGIGRPKELGEAIGKFARWAVDQDADLLVRDYDLDERSAANLLEYLREQQAATQVIPSDRTIVLERFRDEIGDWRLCVLSPYGGRVHAAWGLAISARIRERFDIDGEALWSDDGIVVRLPDVDFEDAAGCLLCGSGGDRSRGGRADRGWRAGLLGPVRCPLSRERGSLASDPPRLSRATYPSVAAAPEVPKPARGRTPLPRLPDRFGDLQGVLARCPGPAWPAGAPGQAPHPRNLSSGARNGHRFSLRGFPAFRLRGHLHVRGGHTLRLSVAQPPCLWTGTCCASCSARRSCAT